MFCLRQFLGVLVAGGGIALNAKWSRAFPIIAGTALILVWLETFTWLTLLGSQRLHFEVLDKYEAVIVGGIFCLLGVVIILFEK